MPRLQVLTTGIDECSCFISYGFNVHLGLHFFVWIVFMPSAFVMRIR